MKQFHVKDMDRLKDFGFVRSQRYEDWFYVKTHRRENAWVNANTGMITFSSTSKDFVALMCEMYRQGVVEILDDAKGATVTMRVTEEEMRMIYERRKGR